MSKYMNEISKATIKNLWNVASIRIYLLDESKGWEWPMYEEADLNGAKYCRFNDSMELHHITH